MPGAVGVVQGIGRTLLEDVSSAFIGFAGGNALGVVGGLGETAAGVITRNPGQVREGLESAAFALLPRYGFSAGPGFNLGVPPRHVIDRATEIHDTQYEAFERQGIGLLSTRTTQADVQLVGGVFADHRLGPIGQAYRLGLAAFFLGKIGVQEAIGSVP